MAARLLTAHSRASLWNIPKRASIQHTIVISTERRENISGRALPSEKIPFIFVVILLCLFSDNSGCRFSNGWKWDLGTRSLLPQWKEMLKKKHIRDDITAGVSTAVVALPLSLAISLGSGIRVIIKIRFKLYIFMLKYYLFFIYIRSASRIRTGERDSGRRGCGDAWRAQTHCVGARSCYELAGILEITCVYVHKVIENICAMQRGVK